MLIILAAIASFSVTASAITSSMSSYIDGCHFLTANKEIIKKNERDRKSVV